MRHPSPNKIPSVRDHWWKSAVNATGYNLMNRNNAKLVIIY